jgi:hypothetical protein
MRPIWQDLCYGTRMLRKQPGFLLIAIIVFIPASGLLTVCRSSITLVRATQNQEVDKPVEQVHKNIQVLKGLPASQLLPVMHQMRAALGVRCDYCHIAENGKYGLDDKPAKQAARRMLRMVMEINQRHFGGQPAVTCNTCHRGSIAPVAMPGVKQGAFANTTWTEPGTPPSEPLPSVDAILEKYVQALGGKAAIESIRNRTTRLTLLKPKLVNAGTPSAAMIARAEAWTVEITQQAPDKYLSVTTTPDGVITQGFNGAVGWVKTASGQRAMSSAALAQIKRQSDLQQELKLKERYAKLTVTGKETLADRAAWVIDALTPEQRREQLFFDVQTGLLLRRLVLTRTTLGDDPEQTDYEDYRAVDGVKLPFKITVSYLDDNHYGTARLILEVGQNTRIEAAKFDPPPTEK